MLIPDENGGIIPLKPINIPESSLQRRFISELPYEEEHQYKKIIREGNFEITEQHRPLSFYEQIFSRGGFKIEDVRISEGDADFIIYKLRKVNHEK